MSVAWTEFSSSGADSSAFLCAAAALALSAVATAPGQLPAQASCRTAEGSRAEEVRENFREVAELRDSVEAILAREDDLDSAGKVLVTTDSEQMETDVAFVGFDPPQRAVYRIRGLLAEHFAGTPPEERRVSLDLEAPEVTIEEGRFETCSPVAVNDEHVSEALATAGRAIMAETDGDLRGETFAAHLWLFVDWRGRVAHVRMQESSGNELLDEAFVAVAREMEFVPASVAGTPNGVWVLREMTLTLD